MRTIKKIFNTTVSVKEGASRNVLRGIIQYDTLNEVNIRLSDGSKAFNYDGYTNIIFKVLKADGTAYIDSEGDNVIATSPIDGIVTVNLNGQATTAAGLCQSVIEIYSGDDKMTTARFNYEVFEDLDLDEAEVSESQYPIFQNLMADLSALEASIEDAEAARVDAEASRVVAETAREAAEAARVAAEVVRASEASGYVAKAEAAKNAANMSAEAAANSAKMAQQAVSSGAHALTHAATGNDPIRPYMIGSMGGRNLLDNWYFANPINQRGKTEYAVAGYTIDRWRTGRATTSVKLGDSGIVFRSDDAYSGLYQRVENYQWLAGRTVTGSVLIESADATNEYQLVMKTSDTVYRTRAIPAVGIASLTWTLPESVSHFSFVIEPVKSGAGTITIKAAKLELGSAQTLAHQDADGNWVLNDIPNHTEELVKCQRYFRRFPARYMMGTLQETDIAAFRYPLNPPMRISPALSMENGADLTSAIDNGANSVTPTGVTLGWSTTNEVVGFWFTGASGTSFVCERYIDATADL